MSNKHFFAKATAARGELHIYDEVASVGAGYGVNAEIVTKELKKMKPGVPLDIYINSPGGSVFEGVAIHTNLMRWSGKKTVYVDGIAASIAGFLTTAGDEVEIAENAQIMIHEAWGVFAGNKRELAKSGKSLADVDEMLVSNFCRKTKKPKAEVVAALEEETWFTSKTAMEFGLVDRIGGQGTDDINVQALKRFKNCPKEIIDRQLDIDAKFARMQMSMQRFKNRISAPAR